ncbi:MAG TPA: hypothetical protein VES42_04720, partial [Pilimelia sp.]|nr:hypothetical protein [Pilimelia sp.]
VARALGRAAEPSAPPVGGGAGAGVIHREPDPAVAEKLRHALGGSAPDVRRLDEAALAASTAAQRAGLVKILTDQLWTDQADEQLTMKLIRRNGEQSAVLGHLEALGYRQKLLDSVDDDGLHTDLQGLLGPAPAGAPGPVGAAISAARSADVQKLTVADLRAATRQQRVSLLQIMLAMSHSNAAEEARIVDILEAGDVAGVMADVKALGLKQRLFDHLDDDGAKQRLTTLLKPLGDAELDADLLVFNRGFFANVGEGIKAGFASAAKNFSLGAIVMGMLQPIIHPIDTVAKHIDDAEQVIKTPSVDRVLALFRDIFGTLGVWLLVAAGVVAAVGVAVSAGVVTLPAGIAIEGVAASLLTAATWCGVAFIVLTILKLLLDTGEAGAATTAQEHQTESEQVGEGITALGVVLALAGLVRGLGRIIKGLRGAAEDPAKATPDQLQKQAQEAKDAQAKAAEEANKLKDAAEQKKGGGRVGFKPGVYDAADPAKTPGEWTFKDKVTEPTPDNPLRIAETEFESPTKVKGMGRRAINPKTGEVEMQEISVPPEARWINTDPPLVEGKGTPTAAYVSMRLLKLLGVAAGSVKTVLIRNIWNLEAILELRKLEATLPRDEAVAKTNSVTSQETALTQTGHRVTGVRVKPGTGKVASLKEVLEYWETERETLKEPNPDIVKRHNKILEDYKLTREQATSGKFFWDYDIEVSLEPLPGAGPPAGGGPAPGLPTVVPVPNAGDKDAGT